MEGATPESGPIQDRLAGLLAALPRKSPPERGYAAGNILNLLRHIGTNVSGYDCSHLTISQADFQDIELKGTNFAHSHLDRCLFSETFGSILCVAFSPDGRLLAAGDNKNEIRLWEVAGGRQFAPLRGHTDWIRSIAFSPDGTILASASADRTVKLWDLKTLRCRKTLEGHTDRVWSVVFGPDGMTIVSGGQDNLVKIWDVETGNCLRALVGHDEWVQSVSCGPDGDTIASGSADETVRLWSARSGDCQRVFVDRGQNWSHFRGRN